MQDVAFGWRDGLRMNGCTVADVNYDDRLDAFASSHIDKDGEYKRMYSSEGAARLAASTLLSDCHRFWPDVVLIVSGMFVPLDIVDAMRSRGHRVVFLDTESPYEDDRQLTKAAHADMVLLNDPTNLETFRERQPNTHYVPHAYDPRRHHPGPANPLMSCDFAFVGTGFPSRVEFFEQCDLEGLDVILGGCWVSLPDDSPLDPLLGHPKPFCMGNDETAELYRSTKTSLNLYRREAGFHGNDPTGPATEQGWACGPREIELAACGTWFCRDARPESDELFPMLPTFTEPGEVRPLLDWALTHPEEREEAALKAQAAIADRTFQANAAWFLQQLGD